MVPGTRNPTESLLTTDSIRGVSRSSPPNPAYPAKRAARSEIMSQNIATYNDCVTSLRTSLNFLESSVETLGNGVSDFPRLTNILKTVRVRPPLLLHMERVWQD